MARRHRSDDAYDEHSEVDDLGALIADDLAYQDKPRRERRRSRRGKRNHSLLIISLLLAVVIGGVAVFFAKDLIDSFGSVPDYTGDGKETVQVRVDPGDTLSDIAMKLEEAGVVKSAKAFTEAAKENTDAQSIQPGLYDLKTEMKASLVIERMLDPAARLSKRVTIPEGLTVKETLSTLAEGTGMSVADLEAVLADRANLGLPAWYPSDAPVLEGVLQPGTYDFDPEDTPLQVIQALVAQFNAVTTQVGLEQNAAAIGQSPYNVLIIASLIEEEAKWDDERAKIARVIYNRLAKPMALQIDAATAYGVGKKGNELTKADLEDKSNPYNLRVLPGLPPTPIAGVGVASLEAALNPADGTWLYYVVTSADGHHTFATTDAEFLAAKKICQDNGWC